MKHRILSILSFSLFGAWLLSFAYEGQILYALLGTYSVDSAYLIPGAILSHAIGLFLCGFIVKTSASARKMMLLCVMICLIGSSVFFFPPSALWTIALFIVAFFAGLWNASWGHFYFACSLSQERMGTVAASIAGSTTLMIGLNMSAIHLHPRIGLLLSMLSLAASLYFIVRLPKEEPERESPKSAGVQVSVRKPMTLLCLFIVIITLSSGLMFQVVNPAFAHLPLLTSWYWAVPYIVALIVVARLPRTINRGYLLYAALAMIGFGFLAFMILDYSAGSYLIVNTLLLGAFGVTDLFWWSTLGEMLEYHKNPARILGLGLSVNVAGVLLGEWISGIASGSGIENIPTLVSLGAVCAAIVVLPLLQRSISLSLKNSSFFYTLEAMPPEKQKAAVEGFLHASELTEREREITALLLRGYTYRLIAQELYISESTVKTHIQNIYYKFDVHNKTELIQKLTSQPL